MTVTELIDQLEAGAQATGLAWWGTPTVAMIHRAAPLDPLVIVLIAMAQMLRSGEDPNWVAGGDTARVVVMEAARWVDAGVKARHVADWLRPRCHRPETARDLSAEGIMPRDLLDNMGRPHQVVDVAACPTPVALAVANGDLSIPGALDALRNQEGRQ